MQTQTQIQRPGLIVQVFSLMVFFFTAAPASQAKTLIENGDFKQKDAEGRPNSWNIWGRIIPPDAKSTGTHLRIKGTGEDAGNLAVAGGMQRIPTPPKKTEVTLTARVRCQDFAKRPGKPDDHYEIYLQAKFADGREVYFGSSKLQTRERTWQQLTVTARIPEGAVELVVLFNIGGLGTLEVDDVKLEAK